MALIRTDWYEFFSYGSDKNRLVRGGTRCPDGLRWYDVSIWYEVVRHFQRAYLEVERAYLEVERA